MIHAKLRNEYPTSKCFNVIAILRTTVEKSGQQFELHVEFSVDARQEEIDAVFFRSSSLRADDQRTEVILKILSSRSVRSVSLESAKIKASNTKKTRCRWYRCRCVVASYDLQKSEKEKKEVIDSLNSLIPSSCFFRFPSLFILSLSSVAQLVTRWLENTKPPSLVERNRQIVM